MDVQTGQGCPRAGSPDVNHVLFSGKHTLAVGRELAVEERRTIVGTHCLHIHQGGFCDGFVFDPHNHYVAAANVENDHTRVVSGDRDFSYFTVVGRSHEECCPVEGLLVVEGHDDLAEGLT